MSSPHQSYVGGGGDYNKVLPSEQTFFADIILFFEKSRPYVRIFAYYNPQIFSKHV